MARIFVVEDGVVQDAGSERTLLDVGRSSKVIIL